MSAEVVLYNSVISDMSGGLLIVGWIIVTHCKSLLRSLSKLNPHKLQYIKNSAARTVSNTCRYTSITPLLKKLHWLPFEHYSVLKTATLVYKFLHTGFPKYLGLYLSSYISSFCTRHSQRGGNFLTIPKFYPSIYKSVKQFGFDAPTDALLFLMRFVHPSP